MVKVVTKVLKEKRVETISPVLRPAMGRVKGSEVIIIRTGVVPCQLYGGVCAKCQRKQHTHTSPERLVATAPKVPGSRCVRARKCTRKSFRERTPTSTGRTVEMSKARIGCHDEGS